MASRITLEVPEDVSEPGRKKAHAAAVLALWEGGEISASRAAEELGLSAHEFLDLLSDKGLPVVRDFDPEAVEEVKRKLSAVKHS
jgi:predicted HTH domain antitoxin